MAVWFLIHPTAVPSLASVEPGSAGSGAARPSMQEPATATATLLEAAEEGDPKSQFELAMAYLRGRGVPRNNMEAAKWFRKAAIQNYANAESELGLLYAKGMGVPQDLAEAMRWFRKAAEEGNATGQYYLGSSYANGIRGRKDFAEAVKWFSQAAEQGHIAAQRDLGLMYAKGLGVTQDYIQAYMWLDLSAGSKGEDRGEAAAWRETVAKKMTREQVEEAQRLAREWRLKQPK